jgi:hypothetical protein
MALSGIVLNTTFSDTTLPLRQTYDERIGQHAAMLAWWVPDATRLTLNSGRVASIADRGTGGRVASQGTAGKQPLFNAAVAAINNRPSLTFDSVRLDFMTTTAAVPGATWTKIALVKPPAEPTSNVFHDILSGHTTSSTTVGIHRFAVRGVNTFQSRVGPSTNLAQANATMTPDAWQLVMATWDAATTTTKVAVNGGTWGTSTVAGATCTDTVLVLGAVNTGGVSPFIGDMADAMLLNVDLSASANAALLATVKQYYRDRYSLTVA